MSYGHTFNEEMREKLMKAALKYKDDPQARAELNSMIMEIQQPYIDLLDKIKELLK